MAQYPLPRPFPKSSGFNDPRPWGKHAASDYACPIGTPVLCAAYGVVKFAGWGGNAGNLIEIEDASGLRTRYAHLKSIGVQAKQPLNPGQQIGLSGNTTNIAGGVGPHLHFAVWYSTLPAAMTIQTNPYRDPNYNYWAVDPEIWLAKEGDEMDAGLEQKLKEAFVDPYTDSLGRKWPNKWAFLMAHTEAFDINRQKWLDGKA